MAPTSRPIQVPTPTSTLRDGTTYDTSVQQAMLDPATEHTLRRNLEAIHPRNPLAIHTDIHLKAVHTLPKRDVLSELNHRNLTQLWQCDDKFGILDRVIRCPVAVFSSIGEVPGTKLP